MSFSDILMVIQILLMVYFESKEEKSDQSRKAKIDEILQSKHGEEDSADMR